MRKFKVLGVFGLVLGGLMGVAVPSANAVQVGDTAPLFQTVDEHMQAIDMADMIDGRPLVIVVGSAS